MKPIWKWAGLAVCIIGLGIAAPAQDPDVKLTEPEILSFLKSRVPGAFDMLMATRERDPDGYQEQLKELGAQVEFYHQIRQRSPDYAESLLRAQYVAIKTESVSGKVKAASPGPEREALVQELRGLLEEQFDLELQKPEMEVQSLEKEVRRLRELIERQKQSRDAIVALRLKALTGEESGDAP